MRKYLLCTLLVLLLLMPSVGCKSNHALPSSATTSEDDYTLDMAIANGDYVDVHGITYNDDAMDVFLEKAAAQKAASIRIVRYTIEGDPILTNIVYDGSIFTVTEDSSRDSFGAWGVGTNYYTTLEIVYLPEDNITEYRLVDPAEMSQSFPRDSELLKSDIGNTTKPVSSPDSIQFSDVDSAAAESAIP